MTDILYALINQTGNSNETSILRNKLVWQEERYLNEKN